MFCFVCLFKIETHLESQPFSVFLTLVEAVVSVVVILVVEQNFVATPVLIAQLTNEQMDSPPILPRKSSVKSIRQILQSVHS
jgi:hypothetical protein